MVSEILARLRGRTLARVHALADGDLVLEFEGGAGRVRLGAGAGRSCLYLLRAHPPLAGTPPPFASRVSEEGSGAALEGLEKEPEERVVRFRLRGAAGARTLVAELLGRHANLLWLDGGDRILAWSRSLHSEFRAPRAGESYSPPPAAGRPGLVSAGAPDLEDLLRQGGGGAEDLERALAQRIRGLGGLLARELVWQVGEGGRSPAQAWEDLRERLRAGRWEPRLYSPRPLDEISEDTPLEPRTFFAAPWPMGCWGGLAARDFPTLSEALEAHDRLRERWLRLDGARRDLAASFDSERRRLGKLIGALNDDLARGSEAERYRGWGDLLLREQASLRIEGREAVAVDRYGGGAEVRVPIDPALSPRRNAEAMFRRYRRLSRAGPRIEPRLAEAERRLRALEPLAAQARSARSLAEVEALAERWRIAPRGAAQSRTLTAPAGEQEGPRPQAREYRSSEGWTILVGRGARANERLTFGVAAPHDFWMHAADYPGAHVVVRNPRRMGEPPPRTLEEAAALAAWFSKARGSTKVRVHYTQRRHVRRPRGAPPGQVLLKRFRSLDVRPRPPAE